MRAHLQLIAILLASLGVVAQNAESPTTHSSNPPPEQPQSVSPSVPRTGGPSDHCAIPAKPPSPNNVAMDRKKNDVSGGGLIKRVNAKYPAAARHAHIQGTVVLCATISKDGFVQNVRPLFGPQELIPAAVEAAEQWRYEPYRVKKEPVEVESEIRMDFILPR
jgi:TonB family protein